MNNTSNYLLGLIVGGVVSASFLICYLTKWESAPAGTLLAIACIGMVFGFLGSLINE